MKKLTCIAFLIILILPNIKAQTTTNSDWWKSTSIYQIYPRSFKDSNDDGIGDINGIISKLDYIQDLGFECIWISPFFESPQKDFGYDVSDYIKINEEYGKEGDAERLIQEVHKRKMKIVFDLVLNHTSIEHSWFQESIDSTSEKADWYIWQDGKGDKAPNNWKNMTGQVGWQYNSERGQWFWGSFLPFQPDLNWRNQEVRDTMFNTVRYWLNKGVDGFRLDIFNVILEDSEFKDNPYGFNYLPGPENPAGGFQRLRNNFNHPDNYQVALDLRKVMNEYEGRFLLGEVDGEHENIKGFLGPNQDGLHSIFLFDLIYYQFSSDFFKDKIKTYELHYPSPNVPVYVFSNHDNRRSIGRIDKNLNKAKLIALFQLTGRGISVTYQGEEFGSSDTRILRKDAKDPIAELFHFPQFFIDRLPWLINRDECRTPIQWNANSNAGFCAPDIQTWLPINLEYKTINAENALKDSLSLIHVYRNLLHLRKENPVFQKGSSKIIENKNLNKDIYLLERKLGDDKIYIMINFGKEEVEISNFLNIRDIIYEVGEHSAVDEAIIKLPAYSGIILK